MATPRRLGFGWGVNEAQRCEGRPPPVSAGWAGELVAARSQAGHAACGMEQGGQQRDDMSGIESAAGIDMIATIKALNSTKIPSEQKTRASLRLRLDTKATD